MHIRTLAGVFTFLICTAAVPTLAQTSIPIETLGEVVCSGNGDQALLLIPCASCRWRSFDQFMERNADKYTMYAVTLPGYGGTEPLDLPTFGDVRLWQPRVLEGFGELIEREDLNHFVLVGHSFGTIIAVQVAAQHPDKVAGLINLDGSLVNAPSWGDQTPGELLAKANDIRAQYMEPLKDPDAWQRFNTPSRAIDPGRRLLYHGWFMASDRVAMTQYWWENLIVDRNDWFRSLHMPVLDVKIIRGSDRTPEETRRQYASRINEVGPPERYRRIFVNGGTHFLMEAHPELFDRIVADFINRRPLTDVDVKQSP